MTPLGKALCPHSRFQSLQPPNFPDPILDLTSVLGAKRPLGPGRNLLGLPALVTWQSLLRETQTHL